MLLQQWYFPVVANILT